MNRCQPDGAVFSRRTIAKIKKRDQGVCYGAEQLIAHGAAPLYKNEDAAAWLARWLPRLTRAVKHPGNFKYCWALDKKIRRHLPESKPYPKLEERHATAI